jgi:hypothetical protein
MAQEKNRMFSGVYGNAVLKVRRGKQIAVSRMAKGTMKQTEATKQCSSTFGVVSKLSATIRSVITPQINGFHDGEMCARMNGELVHILRAAKDPESQHYHFSEGSFARLNGFELNIGSKFSKMMFERPMVQLREGKIKVSLPALQIPVTFKFPVKSDYCKITLSLSLLRFKEGLMFPLPETQITSFHKTDKFMPAQDFDFKVPNNCLCILSIFLDYYKFATTGYELINSKKFNPASICAAIVTPDDVYDPQKQYWLNMVKLD